MELGGPSTTSDNFTFELITIKISPKINLIHKKITLKSHKKKNYIKIT